MLPDAFVIALEKVTVDRTTLGFAYSLVVETSVCTPCDHVLTHHIAGLEGKGFVDVEYN